MNYIKPGVQRLNESGVDPVEKTHLVRDSVEGQKSCSVIYIHSYFRRYWTLKLSFFFIVLKIKGMKIAAQIPGLTIISKCTLIKLAFPTNVFIRNRYRHTDIAGPAHLPVTASTYTLLTQYLRPGVKSLWMIRVSLSCGTKMTPLCSAQKGGVADVPCWDPQSEDRNLKI